MSLRSVHAALAELDTVETGSSGAISIARTEYDGIYVGRSHSGFVLLVEVAAGVGRVDTLSTSLLSAQPLREVLLSEGAEVWSASCSVLYFPQSDPGMLEFGLAVAEIFAGLVARRGGERTAQSCFAILTEFLSLFSLPPRPALDVVIGMLGEMLFLERCPDLNLAVASWRAKSTSRFDFTFPLCRFEVKTSRSRSRVHHVSYDQTSASIKAPIFFASVLVEQAQTGRSGAEVFGSISSRLSPREDLVAVFASVVASTCGEGVSDLFALRFDADLARGELRLFDGADIPAVTGPLLPGVSDVRFRSDFSLATELDWSLIRPFLEEPASR